jgi:hypothetical protein
MYNTIQSPYSEIDQFDFAADFISFFNKIEKVLKTSILAIVFVPLVLLLIVIYYIVIFPISIYVFKKMCKEITSYGILVSKEYTTYNKETIDAAINSLTDDISTLNRTIETFGDNSLPGSKYLYNMALSSRNTLLNLNEQLYIHQYGDLNNISASEKEAYLEEISTLQDSWD